MGGNGESFIPQEFDMMEDVKNEASPIVQNPLVLKWYIWFDFSSREKVFTSQGQYRLYEECSIVSKDQ